MEFAVQTLFKSITTVYKLHPILNSNNLIQKKNWSLLLSKDVFYTIDIIKCCLLIQMCLKSSKNSNKKHIYTGVKDGRMLIFLKVYIYFTCLHTYIIKFFQIRKNLCKEISWLIWNIEFLYSKIPYFWMF